MMNPTLSRTDKELVGPVQSKQIVDCVRSPEFIEAGSNSTKDVQTDQDSTKSLVIRATPLGRTVHWEELVSRN